jgi:hypothetical protein
MLRQKENLQNVEWLSEVGKCELPNRLELEDPGEASSCAATQDVSNMLWNQKDYDPDPKNPASVQSRPPHPIFPRCNLILYTHLRPGLTSYHFSSDFRTTYILSSSSSSSSSAAAA